MKNNNIKKILLIGAGEAGVMILKELKKLSKYCVFGFLDDDNKKLGKFINNVEVKGRISEVYKIVKENNIDIIYLTMPSVSREIVRNIISILKRNNIYNEIELKILPSIYDIISGNAYLNQIKNIDVEDILGRKPICLDMKETEHYLKNKVILITGAGGSIGSEICKQILEFKPHKMILLGHGENSIFNIYNELKNRKLGLITEIIPIIADIRNKYLIDNIFDKTKPQIIFHCAAHKHVEFMENNYLEAFENNILGTMNIQDIAIKYKTEKMVFISTDKAVYPTNFMGFTKRIGEFLMQNHLKCKTEFVIVRFGNVIGSRGSVVKIFKNNIKKRLPLKVRGKNIKRYFMTIPEASQLVIRASSLNKIGKFILDMGKPVKIYDLAKQMIELSGLDENDIPIIISDILKGEKIDEDLFYNEEKKMMEKIDDIPLLYSVFKDNISDIKLKIEELYNYIKSSNKENIDYNILYKRIVGN